MLRPADRKGFLKTSGFSTAEVLLLFLFTSLFPVSLASCVVMGEVPTGRCGAEVGSEPCWEVTCCSGEGVPEYLTTGGHGDEWEVSKPLERLPLQHLTTGGQGDKWEVSKPLERLPLPPSTTR